MIFAAVILTPYLYCMVRLYMVSDYRNRVLEMVSHESDRRIAEQRYDEWRPLYESLRGVSFNRMVFGFKPLRSYYVGTLLEAEGLVPRD